MVYVAQLADSVALLLWTAPTPVEAVVKKEVVRMNLLLTLMVEVFKAVLKILGDLLVKRVTSAKAKNVNSSRRKD